MIPWQQKCTDCHMTEPECSLHFTLGLPELKVRDNALKRPFQITTSDCDTRVTVGSYETGKKKTSGKSYVL